jgi:acetyl-CoA acetyltransferase
VGAWTILAAQRCLEDAGVRPEEVDGVVAAPVGMGEPWMPREIPEDFAKAYLPTPGNPNDGLDGVSSDWLVRNMPGLKNVKYTMHGPGCMSNALNVAAQAVGDGLTHTCLVIRGMGNIAGRYGHYGANFSDTAPGPGQWTNPWGWTLIPQIAYGFNAYCRKYGSNHDRMAPFVVNQRRNGLMNPDGYYYQNRPEVLTTEDYLAGRWIGRPLCIYDCDLPIQVCAAFLFTTPERARDMKQTPVYILNHVQNRLKVRSSAQTLDETEATTDSLARMLYEGSGLTPRELDVFNPYDGFTLFTQYYLEAMQWHGVKRGEAHDFYAGDIRVEGPHPFSSSGGNNGNGRTRVWMHTDCIQQLRGQAGERQVRIKAETAISGGPVPGGGNWTVWGTSPD